MKEEEEDEEWVVPMCNFNFISQHLKKKKIDGNVFAADEPSAGIKGSGKRRERTPNPHSAVPQCTRAQRFTLTTKFMSNTPMTTSDDDGGRRRRKERKRAKEGRRGGAEERR